MLQVVPGTHLVNNIDAGEEAESGLPRVRDGLGRSGEDGWPLCLKGSAVELSDGEQWSGKVRPWGLRLGGAGEGGVDTRLGGGESTDQEFGRQNKSEVRKQ